MAEDHRLGAPYWIDHYVVATSDLARWEGFCANVLGATEPWGDTEPPPGQARFGGFLHLGGSHVAAFVQQRPIPPGKGLGTGCPRYGLYVRQEEIDEHLRRLDEHGVPHTDAVHRSDYGEPGVSILFEDPDQNQLEFWAPDRMPDGAMDGSSPVDVGRISHAVLESRDLDRTATFYSRYCSLDPLRGSDVANDYLVCPFLGGARLIFKKVDALDVRTGGSTLWRGVHNAYAIRDDEFLPAYKRAWDALSEWDYDNQAQGAHPDPSSLPARTGMHGSVAGRRWKAMYGRGDQFYDWDTNSFHFVGGSSASPTMATYEAHYMEEYVDAFMKAKGNG